MESSVDIEYNGTTYTIGFDYDPGDPGRTYGPPENCYPPEPPSLEIWIITDDPLIEAAYDNDEEAQQYFYNAVGDYINTYENDEPDYDYIDYEQDYKYQQKPWNGR